MESGNPSATVHLFRVPTYSYAAVAFIVRIDGVEAARIRQNERIRIQVSPGRHHIQVASWTRQGSGTLSFVAAAGQDVGFVCQGTMRPLRPIDLERDDSVAAGGGDPSAAAAAYRYQYRPASPTAFGESPPPPPPAGQAPARVEVIETDQYEEPLGEESRIIDNQRSATGVSRSVRASREWTRTMSIGGEQARTYGAEIGGGPAWLRLKGTVEQELHRTYSTETQTKQVFSEEITITVPERTSVRLVLRWKRIWQRGVVRVTEADGSVHEVPYQVVVNITFDQSQRDAEPDPGPTTPLAWRPPPAG